MTVSLSLLAGAGWQFFDDNGNPLSGGLLYTYEAGTATPQTTYTDSNGNVANANPIVLDAAGRVPYQVWLTSSASYKFILKTSTGVTVWTEDDVEADLDAAALAASNGSSLIGFLQAGTGAVARTVQSKLRDVVSVLDFGADPTGVSDSTTAIQNAINSGSKNVYLPAGTYRITSPLTMAGGVSLIGANKTGTIISKSTSTVGVGSNVARAGTRTDSYAVDAVVILTHADNDYNYSTQIRNLTLKKAAYAASSYGIYAPRCSQFCFEELLIQNCNVGYYTFDSWMANLKNVVVQACAIGYQHADDGSGLGTGTSITFQNCWANFDNTIAQPTTAFSIFGLTYSSLISCASDNAIRVDGAGIYNYTFLTCTGISMNGCGAENFKGGFINAQSGHVTVIETRTFASTGVASGTIGMVYADAASVTLVGCNFAAPTSPGVIYNWVIQNGSKVMEVNPYASPSGGNAFVGYSGGSTKTTITASGTTITNSSGSYTLPTKVTGAVSLTAATPATIFTVPGAGAYYLYVYVGSSGSAYRSAYLITSDGVQADATALKAGANLTVSTSGLNVQVTSAATAGANWTIVQQTQV